MFSLKNWSSVLPVIKETFMRFPLVLICALSATFIALLLVNEIIMEGKDSSGLLLFTLVFSAVSLVPLKLLVESENWSLRNQIIGVAVVITFVILFTWGIIVKPAPSVYLFLSLAIVISFLFAPYVKRKSTASSFWFFNYQTGIAVFFAAVATIILGAGLSLIIVSVGYLFEVKISNKLYADVWILSWGILFVIYFLANISKEFDFKEESCGFPKGIRFITNYIMVPLMWAYMAILYAYFFKIMFQWELPRGNLGWMITTFGTVGIVTKLLAYPIRNDGTYLLKLFDKYYYYALIIPIMLLGIAIGIRINDYGLTEVRYSVVLLGIWFLAVALLTVIKKERFHIKYVPMIFAVLAFFASFGPWGAFEMSINNQLGRFESALIKHGLLVDGQVIKHQGELSFSERQSLSSMADYLTRNVDRYNRIKPLFSTLLAETETKINEGTPNNKRSAKELIALMGFEYINRWRREEKIETFNYYNGYIFDVNNTILNISGYDFIGKGYFYPQSGNSAKSHKVFYKGKPTYITLAQKVDTIIIKAHDDQVELNLNNFVWDLMAQNIKTKTRDNEDKFIFTKSSKHNSFNVRLILENISGKVMDKNNLKIKNVRYVVLLKFKDS